MPPVVLGVKRGGLMLYYRVADSKPKHEGSIMKAIFYVAVALGLANPKKLTRQYQAITPGGGY
jgi:hypothetical protein